MAEGINYLDLDEFRDLGFLQEVNRQFFHPLGLALEVETNSDGRVVGLGGIWDYRDDPEGIVYGDCIDVAKVLNVKAEKYRHLSARIALFGCTIQPPKA